MFTGLVDAIGTVTGVRDTRAGRELDIACPYRDLAVGESIACNGACLTVRACRPEWFQVAAVVTSRERTTIDAWRERTHLNLERALPANGRYGGHIVQGHVDAVGEVLRVRRVEDALLVDITAPAELGDLLIPHGSIAVDGVSLTVNALPPGGFQVSLIDHTLTHTTLAALNAGDRVHLEGDVIGKYVRRLVERRLPARGPA
jgi:riboflavin synthase